MPRRDLHERHPSPLATEVPMPWSLRGKMGSFGRSPYNRAMSNRGTLQADLQSRLAARLSRVAAARSREQRIGTFGLGLLGIGCLALVLSFGSTFPHTWWQALGAGIAVLLPVVFWRQRWTRRRKRLEYAAAWIQRSLHRLDDDFAFGQPGGGEYADERHAYSSDLDLFGDDSLFERLNACHTLLGRDALAALLRGELPGDSIVERQEALCELRDQRDLREALEVELCELVGMYPRNELEREVLERRTRALGVWGDAPTPPPERGIERLRVFGLGVVATGMLVATFAVPLPWLWFLPFYFLNLATLTMSRDLVALQGRFEMVRGTLEAWTRVLRLLEEMQVRSPLLVQLQHRLRQDHGTASQAVLQLKRLADQISQRRNAFWLLTFDTLWLWDLHVRRALLRWKRQHGPHLREWLQAAAQMEALCALAAYAEGVPDAVFAEVDASGPVLEAENLAHPLLPANRRVGNDLFLRRPGEAWIVTGSNMSGKSTFLRTAGLAVCMTRLGLPVPARTLRLRDLQVVTCMHAEDSLHEGSSLFHAEVVRLKACLDWVRQGGTTLILLDEILAGTNSRERHIGARAILETLLGLPAITLVSTHDLGLTTVAEALPSQVQVVHFRDHVENGHMSFDYVLRSGPLPSTNALRVMRLVGIDVPDAESAS